MSDEGKDVLQKIVEGMGISDDELEFHDVIETESAVVFEPKLADIVESTVPDTKKLESIDLAELKSTDVVEPELMDSSKPKSTESVNPEPIESVKPKSTDLVEPEPTKSVEPKSADSIELKSTEVVETKSDSDEHKSVKPKKVLKPKSKLLKSNSTDTEEKSKDVVEKSSTDVVDPIPTENVKPTLTSPKKNSKERNGSKDKEESTPTEIVKEKDNTHTKDKDKNNTRKSKESEKTAEDKIAEEIFESSTDTMTSANEKVGTRSTRSKKDSEADKNNEEETIENIQTLLNTEVIRENTTQITKASFIVPKVKPEITEEVDHSGVFIAINPKDSISFLTEEENIEHEQHNPLEARPEIPQVMLDHLDLKKFPNLKINDKSKESSPVVPKKVPQKKNNSKLLAEIHKRMEVRKVLQKKRESILVTTTPVTPTILSRGRGRPRSVTQTPKPTDTPAKPTPKPTNTQAKPSPKPVETVPKPGSIRIRSDKELKATPKVDVVKKTPLPQKVQKKASVDDENETDEENTSLLARPRSARKIKMTDKFKSFVAQEKTIRALIAEHENAPSTSKKSTATPRKPTGDIQIKLKRKKEETTEEEDNDDEETESADEPDDKQIGGRTLRNRKVVKPGTPVKKTPAKPENKKSEAKKPDSKKPEVHKFETKKPELKKFETKKPEVKKPELKKKPDDIKKPEVNKPEPPKKRPRKELISESELSDGYDEVDDEDMDPDFAAHSDSDAISELSFLSLEDLNQDSSEERDNTRTVLDLVRDVFRVMPTWNVHILPNTNTFCIAQITRGVNGIPMLKKCIEMDLDFNVKVYVHQIHYKKYDGIYDSEDHLVELLQLVDAM